MKKSVKAAVGALLCGAALFVAVAPASAQTPGTAVGTLATTNLKANLWVAGAQPTFSTTGGAVITMPAVGSTGTITSGGLCLDASGAGPIAAVCNGSAAQQFKAERSSNGTTFSLNTGDSRKLSLAGNTTSGKLIFAAYTTGGTPWLKSALTASHSKVALNAATTDPMPTFSGKGEPGLTVRVTLNDGTVIATATVAANGTWSAKSTVTLDASYTVTAVQNDGVHSGNDSLAVTVVGAPVADPMLAGGSVIAVSLVAVAAFAAKRRRTAASS